MSKKMNKQINTLGHCPGNEIKVLLELLGAVDYNHSSKDGSRFYSFDNKYVNQLFKLIIDTNHSDLN